MAFLDQISAGDGGGNHILIGILVAITIWVILMLCLICRRRRRAWLKRQIERMKVVQVFADGKAKSAASTSAVPQQTSRSESDLRLPSSLRRGLSDRSSRGESAAVTIQRLEVTAGNDGAPSGTMDAHSSGKANVSASKGKATVSVSPPDVAPEEDKAELSRQALAEGSVIVHSSTSCTTPARSPSFMPPDAFKSAAPSGSSTPESDSSSQPNRLPKGDVMVRSSQIGWLHSLTNSLEDNSSDEDVDVVSAQPEALARAHSAKFAKYLQESAILEEGSLSDSGNESDGCMDGVEHGASGRKNIREMRV